MIDKLLDSCVFEVITAGNESKFSRHHIYLSIFSLMHLYALRFVQLNEYALNEVIQELFDCIVFVVYDVVIVGVSEDTPEHETPSDPFNAVLSVVDVTTSYLSIYVVV